MLPLVLLVLGSLLVYEWSRPKSAPVPAPAPGPAPAPAPPNVAPGVIPSIPIPSIPIPPPGVLSTPEAVTLQPGAMSLVLSQGQLVSLNLPSGAQWNPNPLIQIGSAPAAITLLPATAFGSLGLPNSGQTPATFMYLGGGGGSVFASWADGSGQPQVTTIVVTG